MTIRRATADDVATLAALEAACFADPWPPAVLAADLRTAAARAWIAEDATGPVAYLIGALVLDEFTIARVGTLTAARRCGNGRRLCQIAIFTGQSEGATAFFLEVRAGNAAAIALYESLGFRVTRRRKSYYADGEDALDMKLEVAP